MPKTIVSRSAIGLENCCRVYRTGHLNKIIRFCCPEMPDPVNDGVAYVDEMNKINEKFFQPYFDDPFNVDPETVYCDILEFFEGEKERLKNISPDLIAQIDFITNAMTLVRKDASQYFLLNLQNSAMATQIESTIQGLIMNIYMLNTKISILSGYEGEDGLAGTAKVEVAQFKDPRYIMAQFQPDLTMLSFLFPNEPTAKYYMRLKKLLEQSGLYTSKNDITEDMTRFLDRFLVKHDLSLTLGQWLEIKENEELLTTDELEEIEIGKEQLQIIRKRDEFLDEWKQQHGDHSVLKGTFNLTITDIDQVLCRRYDANRFNLDTKIERFKNCAPARRPGIIPYPNVLERMMMVQGSISMTTTNISFDLDSLAQATGSDAQRIIDRLSIVPHKLPTRTIKDNSCIEICEPEKRNYYFPTCSTTRKKSCKSKNNKTRKNICE